MKKISIDNEAIACCAWKTGLKFAIAHLKHQTQKSSNNAEIYEDIFSEYR